MSLLTERLTRTERQPNGCLHWTGYVSPNGYGKVKIDGGKPVSVHVVAFVEADGHLEPDNDVDHQCHNDDPSCPGGWNCLHRRCIEPTHLVARSRKDNLARGTNPNNNPARRGGAS